MMFELVGMHFDVNFQISMCEETLSGSEYERLTPSLGTGLSHLATSLVVINLMCGVGCGAIF